MALMLTTQPVQSLALRRPPVWSWPMAFVLAVVLFPPLAELTLFILQQNRDLERLVQQYRPFTDYFANLKQDSPEVNWHRWQALLVFAWLPAIGHELAFRGFILTGLQRRYRPRTAVLLTSFLFALFHMNVFQFIPMFLLGMVLAYLTTRCGSILPSMFFHLTFNTLLLAPSLFPWAQESLVDLFGLSAWARIVLDGTCGAVAAALLAWLTTKYPHPAYVAFLSSDPGLDPSERRPVLVS
jgi:membrane protease YdiL (CAAX protease family)